MRTFRLNKLVRDKIVAHHLAMNAKVKHRVLNDQEFIQSLKEKLLEEADEIDTNDKQAILEELADIQEVLDTMLKASGHSKAELKAAQRAKNSKNGAFKKRHFIDTVSLPASNKWAKYYTKQSDRYPEVK